MMTDIQYKELEERLEQSNDEALKEHFGMLDILEAYIYLRQLTELGNYQYHNVKETESCYLTDQEYDSYIKQIDEIEKVYPEIKRSIDSLSGRESLYNRVK